MLTNPIFFIILGGIILLASLIVYLERHHLAHNAPNTNVVSPLYPVLENAERHNCRITFCQPDCYKEFGLVLECNIHNVGEEWVHVTYPLDTEEDIHKIISIDKISAVEIINDNIAS